MSLISERIRLAILAGLLLSGCTLTAVDTDTIPDLADAFDSPALYKPQIQQEYRIQMGDRLVIRSYYDPRLDQEILVRSDGRVSLLLMNELFVVGMTPAELDEKITEAYGPMVASPEITVIVQESAASNIYLGGEVRHPSVQTMRGSLTALQAVTSAGGFLDSARIDSVILLRKQADGQFSTHKVDYAKVLSNQAKDIYLQADDIIYVPKTKIANVNRWVDQYINKIIPRSVLFSFQWSKVKAGNAAIITPTSP